MERPVSVLSRGAPLRPWAEASIHHHADELRRLHPSMTCCDVVISAPSARWRHACGPYDLLLRIGRSGRSPLVVHRPARERLDLAIDEAFAVARSLLDRDLPGADDEPIFSGEVAELDPARDVGLLVADDGHEARFARPSAGDEFDHLLVGSRVRFHEIVSEEGAEADVVVPAV